MDIFNTISKAATLTSKGLQKSAEIGDSLNYSTAIFSNDPKAKEIANNRVICSSRFKWTKFKTAFYALFLPFLVVGIISLIVSFFHYFEIDIDLSPKILIVPAIWLFGGIVYIGYLSTMKWNIIQMKINTSNDLEPPNKCGF